jgi:fructokinase
VPKQARVKLSSMENAPDLRIGIDLGGTKIAAVALDRAGGPRRSLRVDTPAGDYEATVEAVAALVEDLEGTLGATGTVGVATPGARSLATGRMKNANSACLNGRALKEDLEARLAREVRLENDANCFALSEAVDGAASGASVVFGVILGTGVGGGMVIDRHVVTGANAIAGEWGHNPLPLAGPDDHPPPPCYCGRHGCIETYLSGPGMARDHERSTGQVLDAAGIARRAEDGDASARATHTRSEERLARSLAGVINVLDPHVIVLGGGLSQIRSLYGNVPRLWAAHVFSDEIRTRLAAPRHGDGSGVRGAAWLWGGPPRKLPATPTTDRA